MICIVSQQPSFFNFVPCGTLRMPRQVSDVKNSAWLFGINHI